MKFLRNITVSLFPPTPLKPTNTLQEWASKWLREKKKQVKPATYIHYHFLIYRHILPQLGTQSITSLSQERIDHFLTMLLCCGRLDHKGGLSNTTVSEIAVVLKSILNFSAQHGVCISCRISPLPKSWRRTEHPAMTPLEQQQLEAALQKDDLFCVGIQLALHTGLRVGELCALRWADIDLNRGSIQVTATLQRIQTIDEEKKTKLECSFPKTRSSFREIPLTQNLLNLLALHKSSDSKAFLLTGTPHPAEPRLCQYHFKKILNQCGLPQLNFHILRHTFATRCIEAGADAKTVSELLGHKNVQITLDRYVHPTFSQKKKTIQSISFN